HFVPALLQAEDTIKPSSEVIDDASDLGGDLDDPVLHDETPHVKSDQCGDGRLVIDADRLLRVESLRSRRNEPSGNGDRIQLVGASVVEDEGVGPAVKDDVNVHVEGRPSVAEFELD